MFHCPKPLVSVRHAEFGRSWIFFAVEVARAALGQGALLKRTQFILLCPADRKLELSSLSSLMFTRNVVSSIKTKIWGKDTGTADEIRLASQRQHAASHAWSTDASEGLDYLRARTPYPSYLIKAMFAYHAAAFIKNGKPRYEAALDLGSGPGQLAFHFATRFDKVSARDPSESHIAMGRNLAMLASTEADELERVGLPAADGRKLDFDVGSALEPNIDGQVDSIVIANAFHCFDWSTPESSRDLWSIWSKLLRPNGTIFAIGLVPSVGSLTGPMAERTRPLRQLLMGASFDRRSPISQYYTHSQIRLGAAEFYSTAIMPWTLGDDSLTSAWQSESRGYFVFDFPRDLELPPGFNSPTSDEPLPAWMPEDVQKAVSVGKDAGSGYAYAEDPWRTTTPRKMAQWVRPNFTMSFA